MEVKTILYLSYDGLCDPVGSSQILPYLKGLSLKGYRFLVVSFEKSDRFHSGEAVIRKQIQGFNIEWFPQSYTRKPPVLSSWIDYRTMKRVALRLLHSENVLLIHARSYIPAMAARYFMRKRSVPFLFDMRGFWADERVEGNIWNRKKPVYAFIYKFFKRNEKKLLRDAKAIVSLTENAMHVMIHLWNVDPFKISVIPCAADYEHFKRPSDLRISDLRTQYHIPQNAGKRLIYTGSTGTWYMLEEMAEFFDVFRRKFPGSIWLLCINEYNDYVNQIEKRFQKEVVVRTRVPRSDMPGLIALADYSIMFIRPTFSKKASSPIKFAESLALGVPVICNAGIGDLSLVEEEGFGFKTDDFSQTCFQQLCEKIQSEDFDQEQLRASSAAKFDLPVNIEKYALVYQNCGA